MCNVTQFRAANQPLPITPFRVHFWGWLTSMSSSIICEWPPPGYMYLLKIRDNSLWAHFSWQQWDYSDPDLIIIICPTDIYWTFWRCETSLSHIWWQRWDYSDPDLIIHLPYWCETFSPWEHLDQIQNLRFCDGRSLGDIFSCPEFPVARLDTMNVFSEWSANVLS